MFYCHRPTPDFSHNFLPLSGYKTGAQTRQFHTRKVHSEPLPFDTADSIEGWVKKNREANSEGEDIGWLSQKKNGFEQNVVSNTSPTTT